jgi:hypothetical protein
MLLRTPLCVIAGLVLALAGIEGTPVQGGSAKVTVLRGRIERSVTLKPTRTNVIDGVVVVASGATLRLRPGTTVVAAAASALVVERGGRLIADGTPELPIVFTSAQPEAERRRGDWGGIVINGAAPVGASGLTTEPYDGTGAFGGVDYTDSSGVLRCVRVEYAGFPTFGPDRLAAIGLRGVGSGTVVDRVQAINGDGDGIAVVGGSADAKRLAAVGCSGNGLTATQGWTGTAQFVLTLVRGDLASHTNAGIDLRDCPATVANATIVGGGIGVRVGGTSGRVNNLIAARCRRGGIESRDDATTEAVARGSVSIDGVMLFENGDGSNLDTNLRRALVSAGSTVLEVEPGLVNAYDETVPDLRPRADSAAISGAFRTPDDGSLEPAPYAGAFAPGDGPFWTDGWASFRIPPVPRYLAHAAESPEALARNFLAALAVTDIPALKRTRITKDEFTWYVWPELPASRLPNVTSDFAWSQATLNSLSGLAGLLNQYSGRRFELVGIRFAGGTKDLPSYRVHYDSRVRVRDESGDEYELKLFGSMLEMDGRFKLFSHVID